jgi:hypothetical protein
MKTQRSPSRTRFHGARSLWQISSSRSGGIATFHSAFAGRQERLQRVMQAANQLTEMFQILVGQRRHGVGQYPRYVLQHLPAQLVATKGSGCSVRCGIGSWPA